ncbi:hypothetical protein C2G38_2150457 [Gigaspora rosea]|uniref:Uncharacterized protein n=1 Tax=Gigaspora rosea TaxID=44941 RepID=A0A397U209_9GLOM|nr:hypothetical protein C2G38_2150457 [Gigaspora rosea]
MLLSSLSSFLVKNKPCTLRSPEKNAGSVQFSEAFGQLKNYKLDVAGKTTRDMATGEKLEGYYHVFNSQCFRNSFDEVVVDFFDLVKSTSEEDTIVVVDKYYSHNLNKDNKLYRSKKFKKGLVEHFGAFTGNNNEPYTTANTASNYCSEHRKCVRKLISGLQLLFNAVNSYLQETYPALYTKMAKLNLGTNVPKSFGAFPTIAINFNVISQFHCDLKDHRNTLCVVCPLGIFKGGQLVFPKLKVNNICKKGKFETLFQNKDPDNSDSEIDVHMNNNKKLRASKKRTKKNKNDQKPQSQAHNYERLKIQDEAISTLSPRKKVYRQNTRFNDDH